MLLLLCCALLLVCCCALLRFMTVLNSRRQPSAIRSLQPLMALPGMISLGGGMPNSALFPFRSLSFALDDGTKLELTQEELNEALQYSPTPGLPGFLKQLRELQIREHSPPSPPDSWAISVANGSTDCLFKAFDLLVEEGDNVLIEAPTYSGTLAALRPLKVNFLEIEVDAYGPSSSSSSEPTSRPLTSRALSAHIFLASCAQA